MSTALTETEVVKLRDLEGIVERGLQTFVEVGAALAIIREQKLYRAAHSTFEAYCEERWGWSDRRARQLMDASEVVTSLAETGTMVPVNERQARELARVPEDQRADVWKKAVDTAPVTNGKPKVTAGHVREAASPVVKDGKIDKLGSLRAARERDARRAAREATKPRTPAAPKPAQPAPASPTKVRDSWDVTSVLLFARTGDSVVGADIETVREAVGEMEPDDIDRVRAVRDFCQRIMTEYARRNVDVPEPDAA